MRKRLYLILLLLALAGCKTHQVSTTPIEVQAPDSLPDPLPATDWEFRRTSTKGGVYLPKLPPAGKVKNSHNTDNSQKKSNNTKAKGESIIGDDNAPVVAKKHAVVGDGNTVTAPKKGSGWVWIPIVLVVLFLLWVWSKFSF